jgi:Ca2+-binding EF-hand superfamily protein|eukprot:SAG25_NODE_1081_length_4094_cov_2.950438_2_plen_491_part_00
MSALPPRPPGMSRQQWRAQQFSNVNQGFDLSTSSFVQAGVKAENPFIVIRPTTPRKDRIETKLFGAAHGFRGPPPRRQSRGVARWDGCRESQYGASFYSNMNRIKERRAKARAGGSQQQDPGAAAVERMFRYLQKSNQDIVANFERMDTDGSGELDAGEFRTSLLEMGLGMSDEEMGLVMREIDVDGGGTISIDEFTARMQQVDKRMTLGGRGTVQETLDRIFDFINTSKFRIVDMFNKIDVDGNGELDPLEFHICMKKLGMDMTEQEVSLVMDELDSDGGGTIGIDEFMEEMRKIHRRRKKEEKKSRANSSMARQSVYERRRERSRYAANPGAHPAIEALGAEARINFVLGTEPVAEFGPSRRWRPRTAERFRASSTAFDTSYQESSHSAFIFEDPSSGTRKQRSLPAIDGSLEFFRKSPLADDHSEDGRLRLNNCSLAFTTVQGVRHKYVAERERARWNSLGATREAEQARGSSASSGGRSHSSMAVL